MRWRVPPAARPGGPAPWPARPGGRRRGGADACATGSWRYHLPDRPRNDLPDARGRDERRVEVACGRRRDEGLGQAADAPHEVRPTGRVEFAEDIVGQEEGRPAVDLGE